MIGLIRKTTNELESIVESTNGYDLSLFDTIEIDDPLKVIWKNGKLELKDKSKKELDSEKIKLKKDFFKNKTIEELELYISNDINSIEDVKLLLTDIILILKSKGIFD